MSVRAVLLDSGDTLVDEATEVRHGSDVVVRADLIPGAADLLAWLRGRFPLALVADGPRGSFENVLGGHGLLDAFDALAISGDLGVEKPHPAMFLAALDALGVTESERPEVVMVGNNLRRDIAGANALGLTTVWMDWAPRRRKVPRTPDEQPDFRISHPLQLIEILQEPVDP